MVAGSPPVVNSLDRLTVDTAEPPSNTCESKVVPDGMAVYMAGRAASSESFGPASRAATIALSLPMGVAAARATGTSPPSPVKLPSRKYTRAAAGVGEADGETTGSVALDVGWVVGTAADGPEEPGGGGRLPRSPAPAVQAARTNTSAAGNAVRMPATVRWLVGSVIGVALASRPARLASRRAQDRPVTWRDRRRRVTIGSQGGGGSPPARRPRDSAP
jgi:hypothetical protein